MVAAQAPAPSFSNLTHDSDDPWASAEGATWDPTFSVFGLVQAEVWYCALVKGVGKVPFDPAQHGPDQRATAVTISIIPVLPDQRPTERQLIAESSEWARTVNPSIRALGTTLRGLHNGYVQAQLVPNGEYVDRTTGETKTRTTFKFVQVFPSEDACRTEAEARGRRSGARSAQSAGNNTAAAATSPASPTSTATSAIRRDVAARFLKALWGASGQDVARFGEMIARNPATAAHFTLESAEVVAVVSGA